MNYDKTAPLYDVLTHGYDNYKHENESLLEWLKTPERKIFKNSLILDYGCGTGFLPDEIEIDTQNYIGFDPSAEMVRRAKKKHQDKMILTNKDLTIKFINEVKKVKKKRRVIGLGLWGVGSYMSIEEIKLFINLVDEYVLMFYQNGYVPEIHIKTENYLPTYRYHWPYVEELIKPHTEININGFKLYSSMA